MRTISKVFLILGFLLALLCLPPLRSQTAPNAPAGNNVGATNSIQAGQAPDEVMKRLSDLVHAGKCAEAQGLTAGLLMAYPNDQRLIKAKALLDKSLAAASAKATPSIDPSAGNVAPAQPMVSANAEQLTGMDKVDYNALIELARQAQQTTDLEQQKASLKQFMDQSNSFLQKHPDQLLLWQLRAASAISLNDPMAGYDGGRNF